MPPQGVEAEFSYGQAECRRYRRAGGWFGEEEVTHSPQPRAAIVNPSLAQGSCPAPGTHTRAHTRAHTHTPSSPGSPCGSPAPPAAPGVSVCQCERVCVCQRERVRVFASRIPPPHRARRSPRCPCLLYLCLQKAVERRISDSFPLQINGPDNPGPDA